MADGIIANEEPYHAVVRRLRELGPELQKGYSKKMRETAAPFARDVLITGASSLPKRGGLSYRVASSRPSVQADHLRVMVVFGGKFAKGLGGIEQGIVMHPVFGRRGDDGAYRMVSQRVKRGVFEAPFAAGAPKVREALLRTGQEILARSGR